MREPGTLGCPAPTTTGRRSAGTKTTHASFQRRYTANAGPGTFIVLRSAPVPGAFRRGYRCRAGRAGQSAAALSPLVGRDDLLRRAREVFAHGGARLVTLTGPGASARPDSLQIALDLAIARQVAPVFVDLAPIADPDLVPAAIALALGLQEGGARPILDLIKTCCANPRRCCCWTIVSNPARADRHRVAPVRRPPDDPGDQPRPLRLSGEFELLCRLELPPADQAASPADLVEYSAVRLFVERAWASGAELPLTAETAPAIVAIYRRLDGPAAGPGAGRDLDQGALAHRPPDPPRPHPPLLSGGSRDHPARLRTMRRRRRLELRPPDNR